jgi:hypothetical protein
MAHVRVTVIEPKTGREDEALSVLREIDDLFSNQPELRVSFVFGADSTGKGPFGRVAVWETEGAANQTAMSDRALALRARLGAVSSERVVETLSEIVNSHSLDAAVA